VEYSFIFTIFNILIKEINISLSNKIFVIQLQWFYINICDNRRQFQRGRKCLNKKQEEETTIKINKQKLSKWRIKNLLR
jgi:hypothetical protein